jgi:hypothetical protein
MQYRIFPRRAPRVISMIASLVLVLAAVVAMAGSASAHAIPVSRPNSLCASFVNTGGGRCAHSGPVVLSRRDQTILSKKSALAVEYAQMKAGKVSVAKFQSDRQAFINQYAGSTTARPTLTPYCPVITGGPNVVCGSNWVNLSQQSQTTTYYCGPATASEVLGVRSVYKSQSFLAGSSYLKTDANGGTNWSPYVMGPTLNTLTNSSWYIAVNGSGVGGGFSQSTWENDLTFDVDNSWAIAGNIVEYANTDPHLVGHPRSMTIYHWIGIYGYANYGGGSTYADSVHGDTQFWNWAANVPAYSTISSSDMTTLLNQRGFVW